MIHPAELVHAPVLAAMHALAFPPPERWGSDAMALQLTQPGGFGFLNADADGFVLARTAADEAEILTLAVIPEARRRGLGLRLLAVANEAARRRGATSVVLEVAVNNVAALALYRTAGFDHVGRRRAYYPGGGDALIMRAGLCG